MQSYALPIFFGLVFVSVMVTVFMLGRRQGRSESFRNSAQGPTRPHRVMRVQVINNGWTSEQIDHCRKEVRFWNLSIILNIVYLVLTAIGATAAYLAYKQATTQTKIAQNALISSDRPWISTDASDIFHISGDKIVSDFALSLENSGHSPAIGVVPAILVRAFPTDHEAFLFFRDFCDNAIARIGTAIFPNQKPTITFHEEFSNTEVANFRYYGSHVPDHTNLYW